MFWSKFDQLCTNNNCNYNSVPNTFFTTQNLTVPGNVGNDINFNLYTIIDRSRKVVHESIALGYNSVEK